MSAPRVVPGCSGKLRYVSQAATVNAIALLRRRQSNKRGGTLEAYRCGACSFWHVGHAAWRVRADRFVAGVQLTVRDLPATPEQPTGGDER